MSLVCVLYVNGAVEEEPDDKKGVDSVGVSHKRMKSAGP